MSVDPDPSVSPDQATARPPLPTPSRRPPFFHALALPNFAWAALFFLAPLGLLLVYSFGQWDLLTLNVFFGWTTENYERIGESIYLRAVLRSLAISLGATLACLVIGYPVALAISRQPPRRQTVLLLLVMVPFWTSFVVRTYGLVNLLQDNGPVATVLRWLGLSDGFLGVLYTPWAVMIGIVYTYLPLMILPLYVALERIDRSLEQAAADLGTPRRRVFRRVIFPLSLPGVIAGCIIVGAPATGEYVIPVILGGDKTLVYGNVVATQFLNVGDYPFGSALAVTLMVLVTAFILFGRSRAARAEEAV